jgi:hypothetical protein
LLNNVQKSVTNNIYPSYWFMKVYDVVLQDSERGVYSISVVENPAMEGMFIALSEQHPTEVKLAKVDTEKRILMGLALEPNKKIYRNMDGEEFYIQFSEETIEKAAHLFLTNGYQNKSSLEHQLELEGMSVVESWIIEDEVHDKSRKYGLDHPKGSWMVSMKVNDDIMWENFVKTGMVKGFSIDGLFSLKELKLNKSDMSNQIVEAIKEGFKSITLNKEVEKTEPEATTENVEVKLGLAKLDSGATVEFDGETLESGASIFLKGEVENIPLPTGEYTLEDGVKLSVLEEGTVASVNEDKPSAPEEILEAAPEAAAPVVDPVVAEVKKAVAQLSEELKLEFSKQISELKEAKDAEIKELKAELSKTEGAAPTKHAPKEVSVTASNTVKGRLTQYLNNL